jgi:hypothetical protein
VETFAVDNESREPTWNETLTMIQHIEAKVAQHLSGVDKTEIRELGFAIQTLTAFIIAGAVDENVAAIGRDKQGWIDQQTERLKLFGIEEGEAEGRPPSYAWPNDPEKTRTGVAGSGAVSTLTMRTVGDRVLSRPPLTGDLAIPRVGGLPEAGRRRPHLDAGTVCRVRE